MPSDSLPEPRVAAWPDPITTDVHPARVHAGTTEVHDPSGAARVARRAVVR